MAKSWSEKLHNGKTVQVEVIDKAMWELQPGQKLVIVTPLDVKEYVDSIPAGHRRSMTEMRSHFAKQFSADGCCPMTSGIFLRIVCEYALEQMSHGKAPEEVSPFWRIVDLKSALAKKLSCGVDELARLQKLCP